VTDIPESQEPRIPTGRGELDRVLGGGLVPGSLVLVGGEPGVGKSTLLSEVCNVLAGAGRTVLYVSGEESAAQIKLRAQRLGVASPHMLVLAETDLDAIIAAAEQLRPEAVVIDSIQTMYTASLPSAPGSVAQVRESAADLLRFAKDTGTAVLLVGHVTKDGQIAGPRVLEHIVDTVLYFEGDRQHAYRILRATKNRFGSTNEIGVFEMRPEGLREIANPSAAFLSQRAREAPGSAVVCALEGSRPLLVEVQALVTPTVFGMPRRTASGVDYNRMVVLLAVLEKRAGAALAGQDVYVSIAGGVSVDEPAVDLGLAAAVVSSLRSRLVDDSAVAIGEVGLAGELRAVAQVDKRLQEAARLGFRKAVVPRHGAPERAPAGLETIEAESVPEALAALIG
jgi:DNA repair protein RadA/Sms